MDQEAAVRANDILFTLEDGDGLPSRWNTLRALRVLRWYDQPHPPS